MSRAACAATLVLAGAVGASGAVLAEKADRDMPTQIEAIKMSADDARRMTIFEGSVVLTRGTIRLTADRVVVRQDAEGFQLATATGKPARFRQRQDPKPPETEGVWLEGEALRMEIDDRSGKIELYDNAHVKRGGDEVAGNYILLDQRSDYFSVSTGKDVQAGKEGTTPGRVKAVIQPKPRPPEPPAAAPGAPK
jgi:lipopolysaccharide export system protein LptA